MGKIQLIFSFLSHLHVALLLVVLFQESVHFPHLERNQTFLSPCLSQEEGTEDLGLLLWDLCVALQGSDEQRIDGGGCEVGVKVL